MLQVCIQSHFLEVRLPEEMPLTTDTKAPMNDVIISSSGKYAPTANAMTGSWKSTLNLLNPRLTSTSTAPESTHGIHVRKVCACLSTKKNTQKRTTTSPKPRSHEGVGYVPVNHALRW